MSNRKPAAWQILAPKTIPYHKVITAKEVKAWFDEALGRDDSRPSAAAYEALAREIDMIARPAVVKDIQHTLEDRVGVAARELGKAIENLEEFVGLKSLPHCEEIYSLLPHLTYLAPAATQRGRKKSDWHGAARQLASKIKDALKASNYEGSLNEKSEESVVAVIGALSAKRAFGLRSLKPIGFSQAIKHRNRSKAAAAEHNQKRANSGKAEKPN